MEEVDRFSGRCWLEPVLRRGKCGWVGALACRDYGCQQEIAAKTRLSYSLQLRSQFGCLLALRLAPKHDGVDQGLRLVSCYVAQGGYELVEVGIDSWTTDELNLSLWLAPVRGHAPDDLLVGLADERVEEVVQRIFAHRLQLVVLLVVSRLGAVVHMPALARRAAGGSLRLALPTAAGAIARRPRG